MNTARILSIAAVAAFASIGAQAAELNGDLFAIQTAHDAVHVFAGC